MDQPIYYSKEDLENIIKLVKDNKFNKVYITGHMHSGKSHFSQAFTNFTGFSVIDLDTWRDNYTESRSEVLIRAINLNKNNPYILDHYGLLDEDYVCDAKNPNTLSVWKGEADILIYLDSENDSSSHITNFNRLDGEIIYCNSVTGTRVKSMKNCGANKIKNN